MRFARTGLCAASAAVAGWLAMSVAVADAQQNVPQAPSPQPAATAPASSAATDKEKEKENEKEREQKEKAESKSAAAAKESTAAKSDAAASSKKSSSKTSPKSTADKSDKATTESTDTDISDIPDDGQQHQSTTAPAAEPRPQPFATRESGTASDSDEPGRPATAAQGRSDRTDSQLGEPGADVPAANRRRSASRDPNLGERTERGQSRVQPRVGANVSQDEDRSGEDADDALAPDEDEADADVSEQSADTRPSDPEAEDQPGAVDDATQDEPRSAPSRQPAGRRGEQFRERSPGESAGTDAERRERPVTDPRSSETRSRSRLQDDSDRPTGDFDRRTDDLPDRSRDRSAADANRRRVDTRAAAGDQQDRGASTRMARMQESLGIEFDSGSDDRLVISSIANDSALIEAGLRQGDTIVGINSRRVSAPDSFFRWMQLVQPGTQVALDVLRNGRTETVYLDSTVFATSTAATSREAGDMGLALDVNESDRVVISSLQRDSVLADAGLRRGDVILAVDDRRVSSPNSFYRWIQLVQPGAEVALNVLRNGRPQTIYVDSAMLAPAFEADVYRPSYGRRVEDQYVREERYSVSDRASLGVDLAPSVSSGALVERVHRGSPADEAGIQAGDLIVAINGDRVRSAQDLVSLIGEYAPGDQVEIDFTRREQRAVAAELARDSRPASAEPVRGYRDDRTILYRDEVYDSRFQDGGAYDERVYDDRFYDDRPLDPSGRQTSRLRLDDERDIDEGAVFDRDRDGRRLESLRPFD